MLDISTYRQNESLAKKEMSKWQIRSRHNLDLFEKAGFPVRVDNNQQLRALVDTMSENGFDYYQNSINGFTDNELDSFLAACMKAIEFSEYLFPVDKPILPIHNLAQAFVFYTIINKIKKYDSVLEIGPGSGTLSYFMSQKNDLILYAQAEACESFYILQSHLSKFLFKNSFYESVFLKPECKAADFWTVSNPDSFQPPIELDIPKQDIKAAHYPWWRLGELANNDKQFDIVASNANLLEFSRAALLDYLPLIQKKLKDDGLFVFHCEGAHANGDWDTLLPDLYNHRFAPLFLKYGMQPMGSVKKSCKKIVIAPAGNFATKILLQNKEFTARFEEIVLVDDYKSGQTMEGYKIVSTDDMGALGIKDGIIYHNDKGIVDYFVSKFDKADINILDVKPTGMRSFGVFISDRHVEWGHYYKKENFVNHFNCGDSVFEGLFNFLDRAIGSYYSIETMQKMILDRVLNKNRKDS